MKLLSFLALTLTKLAYRIDPNINVFQDIISAEYEKRFNEFQKQSSTLVGVLFEERNRQKDERLRVSKLSPDEKHQIFNRAEELYCLEHPGELSFKKVGEIEWYTSRATREFLNHENSESKAS